MTAKPLNPTDHPAGTRVLVENNAASAPRYFEAVVREWSPSKLRVCLCYLRSEPFWTQYMPLVAETLPHQWVPVPDPE